MTPLRLGFVGTGNIAGAMVGGLCKTADPPLITLSPRNAEKARALASAWPEHVTVGSDNQAVVDASDVVVLAVLPGQAIEVARALRFRPDQRVISVMALVSTAALADAVAPAPPPIRACPLPSLVHRKGPVTICPPDARARALFAAIGTPIEVEDEAQLEVLWSTTAMIAPFFAWQQTVADWASAAGVPAATATNYVGAMFEGLAVLGRDAVETGFPALVAEAQTKGGLNEQALARLRAAGVYGEIEHALDAILARLGGVPAKKSAGG